MFPRFTLESVLRSGRKLGAVVAPRIAFMVFALLMGLWATQLRGSEAKDWRLYQDTAELLLAGRFGELYPGITPGLPFLYPPFFVWQVAPLGLVPRDAAHACVVAGMLLATAVALWALRTTLDEERRPLERWVWFVLSSAGFTWMLVVGHISGWYLMLLSIALLAWTRGSPLLAGAALSLLLTKPHYGLTILAFVALARGWRVLTAALAGAALLALSTAPLGWRTWTAWATQAEGAGMVLARAPAWKQITLLGTWLSLLSPGPAVAMWALTALPLGGLAAWASWRSGRRGSNRARILGLGVLVSIACAPYGFHYDGLLLSLPALVWYFQPASYRSPRTHTACGVAILVTYVVQHLGGWVLQRGVSLTGAAVAAWLALDSLDLLRAEMGDPVLGALRGEAR